MEKINDVENEASMQRGELFHAFTPSLIAKRARCQHALERFNQAGRAPRRTLVELWKDVTQDNSPLPPPASTEEEDILLLQNEPYIYGPLTVDYGYNLKIGADVNINPNTTFLDTLPITIGARTLIGPNCAFYAGTHPLSPSLRNGTHGPELGKAIEVGEDCWIGGSVVVCPGVKIGRGVTVGAGSVVVKDVEDFVVVVGNPARVVRRLEWVSDDESR